MAMPTDGRTYIYRTDAGDFRQVQSGRHLAVTPEEFFTAVMRYGWLVLNEPFRTIDDLERRRDELADKSA